MITAQQKRKEQRAEYLLCMWQVEDFIRAAGCNMDNIRRLPDALLQTPQEVRLCILLHPANPN
jgi:hypothetical protein